MFTVQQRAMYQKEAEGSSILVNDRVRENMETLRSLYVGSNYSTGLSDRHVTFERPVKQRPAIEKRFCRIKATGSMHIHSYIHTDKSLLHIASHLAGHSTELFKSDQVGSCSIWMHCPKEENAGSQGINAPATQRCACLVHDCGT